jgi:mannose-1-phosphate guanylyltransferase
MNGSYSAPQPTPIDGGWRQASEHRWGVILAGGDGKRLLSLTRRIAGDDRPKQFCTIMGHDTLLGQTQSRTWKSVAPERTCVVVTKSHERFYADRRFASRTSSLLIQPRNQGTAPAIVYSLMRLRELDPGAVVAFFPCDHHFADEEGFTASVKLAFEAAECPPGPVVLLGIVPDAPEVAYGWIEPATPTGFGAGPIFRVGRFWEKPSLSLASALMKRGCLWNSFVMVGTSFAGRFQSYSIRLSRIVQRLVPRRNHQPCLQSIRAFVRAVFPMKCLPLVPTNSRYCRATTWAGATWGSPVGFSPSSDAKGPGRHGHVVGPSIAMPQASPLSDWESRFRHFPSRMS